VLARKGHEKDPAQTEGEMRTVELRGDSPSNGEKTERYSNGGIIREHKEEETR